MKSALPAAISLIASGALHVLVVVALARSASGAEPARDELTPARFFGNTFEIDTVDAADVSARVSPAAPAAPPTPVEQVPPRPPVAHPAPPADRAPSPPEPSLTDPTDSAPALPKVPAASPPALPASAEAPASASSALAPERAPLAADSTAPAVDRAQAATTGVALPSYGQDALPASTASLAKAFTRAVPRIASSDPVWHGLPLGAAGKAVFSIEVDALGKVVGRGTVLDEPTPAPHLERIIGRTVLLIKSQTFAASEAGALVQRFELSAEIRQVAALDDAFAEPQDLRQIGRLVEPTRVRPGKANFTYNSGRQVELTLRLLAQ